VTGTVGRVPPRYSVLGADWERVHPVTRLRQYARSSSIVSRCRSARSRTETQPEDVEKGVRRLRRWEWRLFRKGLRLLYDNIEMRLAVPGTPIETGVRFFDELRDASKLAILALVGKALRDPNEPCPDATALTEGTVAAVYAAIREDVKTETLISSDMFPPNFFRLGTRKLVIRASLEIHPECAVPRPSPRSRNHNPEGPFIPEPDCDDLDVWDKLLDELLGRLINGRRDFADADRFLDANPELRHRARINAANRNRFSMQSPGLGSGRLQHLFLRGA
jgi:hypothetical protein